MRGECTLVHQQMAANSIEHAARHDGCRCRAIEAKSAEAWLCNTCISLLGGLQSRGCIRMPACCCLLYAYLCWAAFSVSTTPHVENSSVCRGSVRPRVVVIISSAANGCSAKSFGCDTKCFGCKGRFVSQIGQQGFSRSITSASVHCAAAP
jgi:hypothetical protein